MFAIALADRLGYVHVDEMLRAMTPREFDERFACEIIEPVGRRNAVIIQAEIVAAVTILARILTASKAEGSIVVPDDLMPKFKSEVKPKQKKQQNLQAGFAQVKQMLRF